MSRSTALSPRKWPPKWAAPHQTLEPLAGTTPPQLATVAPECPEPLSAVTAPLDARRPPATWLPVADVARVLGVDVRPLRRAIARHARCDADGIVLAEFEGVRARKVGRRWRVLLDHAWLADAPASSFEASP